MEPQNGRLFKAMIVYLQFNPANVSLYVSNIDGAVGFDGIVIESKTLIDQPISHNTNSIKSRLTVIFSQVLTVSTVLQGIQVQKY